MANWYAALEQISPSIFRIETPTSFGTGFHCFNTENGLACGVATANHVIREAEKWHQPINLVHYNSQKTVLKEGAERFFFSDPEGDASVVLFAKQPLPLPDKTIQLLPEDKFLKPGNEVCWMGFPDIEPNILCLFSGVVSAWQATKGIYIIDGVGISGVSGGPVICKVPDDPNIYIVGIISSYLSSSNYQGTAPGLLFARSVVPLHARIKDIKSIEEAQRAKELAQAGDSGANG
jgi:hypothetical protein